MTSTHIFADFLLFMQLVNHLQDGFLRDEWPEKYVNVPYYKFVADIFTCLHVSTFYSFYAGIRDQIG